MKYETFAVLPLETRESFLAGYLLPELEMYPALNKLRDTDYDEKTVKELFPELISPNVEAVKDGIKLNAEIWAVFSADTFREYDNDIRTYDALATAINSKYGEIAYLHGDSPLKLGLVGHRKTAFAVATTVVRNYDGTFTTTVEDRLALLEDEDAVMRAAAH